MATLVSVLIQSRLEPRREHEEDDGKQPRDHENADDGRPIDGGQSCPPPRPILRVRGVH